MTILGHEALNEAAQLMESILPWWAASPMAISVSVTLVIGVVVFAVYLTMWWSPWMRRTQLIAMITWGWIIGALLLVPAVDSSRPEYQRARAIGKQFAIDLRGRSALSAQLFIRQVRAEALQIQRLRARLAAVTGKSTAEVSNEDVRRYANAVSQ